MNRLQEHFGSDNSDETLSLIADLTDTYNDMETRANTSNAEWQTKYNDLDNSWRDRYKARFFEQGSAEVMSSQRADVIDDGKVTTFEDLFTEREG